MESPEMSAINSLTVVIKFLIGRYTLVRTGFPPITSDINVDNFGSLDCFGKRL